MRIKREVKDLIKKLVNGEKADSPEELQTFLNHAMFIEKVLRDVKSAMDKEKER